MATVYHEKTTAQALLQLKFSHYYRGHYGYQSTHETPYSALDFQRRDLFLNPEHLIPEVLLHLLLVIALMPDLASESFNLCHDQLTVFVPAVSFSHCSTLISAAIR